MCGDELVDVASAVSTKQEFLNFLYALSDNLDEHPEEWENATLHEYLRMLADYPAEMLKPEAGIEFPANPWGYMAMRLLAAKVYE